MSASDQGLRGSNSLSPQPSAALRLLQECGGYYECLKDRDGRRLGPLVGYAARDEAGRQFVGDVYINFAAAERQGPVLRSLAEDILDRLSRSGLGRIDGFCGAPEGGKALAAALAVLGGRQYMFPEKRVTEAATDQSREKSELRFSRHQPGPGENWILVEDVCNNFSTAASLVDLVARHGAKVVGIACAFNRSAAYRDAFSWDGPAGAGSVPILAQVQTTLAQYRQDDPEVAAEVARGNVVWSPKHEWHRLQSSMQAAGGSGP
jgi:adenine/guanine phosphoribosyltransferase-like PRPP-binding protein